MEDPRAITPPTDREMLADKIADIIKRRSFASNATPYHLGEVIADFIIQRDGEECEAYAVIAESHQYRRPAKIRRNPVMTDDVHESIVASIRDEERGERIAAVEIAKAIRARGTP